MSTKFAFVDEFGQYGFNFESESSSTHFIVSAIIVDEGDLEIVSAGVEEIRKHYFQTGEMKSSKISKDHQRRNLIIQKLLKLPFKIFAVVCDKRKIAENSGLHYKPSFYKFINNLVYKELRITFSNLVIVADEMGDNDYMESFAKYVRSKEIPLSFFDKSLFRFENSKHSVIIQVADIVSGSLAFCYDEHKKLYAEGSNYKAVFDEKILRIKEFPETFESFNVEHADVNPEYDPAIADICFRKAKYFCEIHKKDVTDEVKMQLAVLKYLLFRFMNRSPRKYIPTNELISQLVYLGFEKMSLQAFRNKIIAKLRDEDVIIASSVGGYKIPANENELFDFVDHGKNIIMPMLSRLKRCNDVIKMGTNGKVNLFERAEYQSLAKLMEEKE